MVCWVLEPGMSQKLHRRLPHLFNKREKTKKIGNCKGVEASGGGGVRPGRSLFELRVSSGIFFWNMEPHLQLSPGQFRDLLRPSHSCYKCCRPVSRGDSSVRGIHYTSCFACMPHYHGHRASALWWKKRHQHNTTNTNVGVASTSTSTSTKSLTRTCTRTSTISTTNTNIMIN